MYLDVVVELRKTIQLDRTRLGTLCYHSDDVISPCGRNPRKYGTHAGADPRRAQLKASNLRWRKYQFRKWSSRYGLGCMPRVVTPETYKRPNPSATNLFLFLYINLLKHYHFTSSIMSLPRKSTFFPHKALLTEQNLSDQHGKVSVYPSLVHSVLQWNSIRS